MSKDGRSIAYYSEKKERIVIVEHESIPIHAKFGNNLLAEGEGEVELNLDMYFYGRLTTTYN